MADADIHDSGYRLLVCDAPGFPLEDNLQMLRRIIPSCTYIPSVDDIDSHSDKADVIIISSGIPGGAHGEAFGKLAEKFSHVPLIVVAHTRSLANAIDFFRNGATDYLPVPLSFDETHERISAALTNRETSDTPQEEDNHAEPVDVPVVFEEVAAETHLQTTAQESDGGKVNDNGMINAEKLPCGIMAFDAGGRLVKANSSALSLMGHDSEENLRNALEQDLGSYEPLDIKDRKISPDAWPPRRALKDKTMQAATLSLKRPDHTRVWVRLEATPALAGGRISEMVVTLCNITEECAKIRSLRKKHKSD